MSGLTSLIKMAQTANKTVNIRFKVKSELLRGKESLEEILTSVTGKLCSGISTMKKPSPEMEKIDNPVKVGGKNSSYPVNTREIMVPQTLDMDRIIDLFKIEKNDNAHYYHIRSFTGGDSKGRLGMTVIYSPAFNSNAGDSEKMSTQTIKDFDLEGDEYLEF